MSLQPYFEEWEAGQAVKLLEVQKARISNQLDVAQARHASLRNQRVVITSSLPDEILGLIFFTAKQIPRSSASKLPVELRLSQVSSHWRIVAARTSELWTDIEVSVRRPTGSLEAYVAWSDRRPWPLPSTFATPPSHSDSVVSSDLRCSAPVPWTS